MSQEFDDGPALLDIWAPPVDKSETVERPIDNTGWTKDVAQYFPSTRDISGVKLPSQEADISYDIKEKIGTNEVTSSAN